MAKQKDVVRAELTGRWGWVAERWAEEERQKWRERSAWRETTEQIEHDMLASIQAAAEVDFTTFTKSRPSQHVDEDENEVEIDG